MPEPTVYAGIDVSEASLEVAVRPSLAAWSVDTNEKAVRALAKRLTKLGVGLVVMEATGQVEAPIAAILAEAGLHLAIVNPRQVRDFARSTGRLAKTDRIDAQMIAHFAEAVKPEPRALPDAETAELRALLARRSQVVEMLREERQRLHRVATGVRPRLEAHIAWLKEESDDLDKTLHERLRHSSVWREQDNLLQSAPGVGPIVSLALLLWMPELGKVDRKAAAALLGVAPFNVDSGKHRGRRRIWGGREHLRQILYMGTLSAIRWNPTFRDFYDRLISVGKPKKVAQVACMHKLLTMLNAMMRTHARWTPALRTA